MLKNKTFIQRELLKWYQKHKRDLPWRKTHDPYAIWVSEIMLQQTQVAQAIKYYEKFLKRFPDIKTLARSDLRVVLSYWAGLGYYARAKNLHKACRILHRKNRGSFPTQFEEIIKLPGIASYSASAIASIAFNQARAAVDGNVQRVLSRLFAIKNQITKSKARLKIYRVAQNLIHIKHPGDFNQALMDLGQMVCVPKNPQCETCPLLASCEAKHLNIQNKIPYQEKKVKPKLLNWQAVVAYSNCKVALAYRKNEKLLKNQWGLPSPGNLNIRPLKLKASLSHAITNHKIHLKVYEAHVQKHSINGQIKWIKRSQLKNYLISSIWWKAIKRVGG